MSISSNMVEKTFQSLQDATQQVVSQALLRHSGDDMISLTKCGSLACQHDSFQTSLDQGKILSIAQYEERSKKRNKSANKGYVIVPDDSIFFPAGGGQPCDQGTLVICEKGNNTPQTKLWVSDARNVNGVCVLTCKPSSTSDLDSSLLPRVMEMASASAQSESDNSIHIKQKLDWDRRFDFMTQHSAQHLISAEGFNLLGIETHSFSLQLLGASYIDLLVNPEIDLKDHVESMKRVEVVVNERIRDNLPMTPKWLDPNDEEFKSKVRSRLLPDGLTGKIRLMEIDNGNIDCNTCCGTHVPSLGHLQMIKFFKMSKVKPNVMRVWYGAGKRLLDIMQENAVRQEQITNLLSCNPQEHATRVEQLLEDKRSKEKEIKALNGKACSLQAKEIVQECQASNGVAVVDLGPSADMSFMNQLSAAVLEQIDAAQPILLLFLQGEKENGTFLLTGSEADVVNGIGKRVAEVLGGRGGGKNGRFQGKGTKIQSGMPEAIQLLRESCA